MNVVVNFEVIASDCIFVMLTIMAPEAAKVGHCRAVSCQALYPPPGIRNFLGILSGSASPELLMA